MKEGSFEDGSQVQAANRCKLLSSKAMVVSVAVNVGTISRRVGLREASASEPSMKCRKCPSGIRHVGGAKLNLALVWNVRTWPAMLRERHKRLQP